MNYLPWMWAWTELKKHYPLSYSTVHETEDGMLVWRDPSGCHVKTSVTIVWEEDDGIHEHTVTEYLPCMDFKNKSLDYDNTDSMNVNKAVQRSLTKCIARLGLGYYLFVGDDLPEASVNIIELRNKCKELIKKKCAISESAKEKVAKYCKEAERKANPDLPEDLITGNPASIDDEDVLEELSKYLMSIR